MSVIPIEEAMLHLRAEPEDQADIQLKLDAAEEKAMAFLQRRFYADETSLKSDLTTVKHRIETTRVEYDETIKQAELTDNSEDRQLLKDYAEATFKDEQKQIRMIAKGMVINDSVKTGVLLILGDIYENRGDYQPQNSYNNTVIPEVSRYWLIDYRVDMGV